MDYISRLDSSKDMHLNWSGWDYIRGIIALEDGDIKEYSGSNDGNTASSEATLNWGKAIRKFIEEGRNAVTINKDYSGGHKSYPYLVRKGEDSEWIINQDIEQSLHIYNEMAVRLHAGGKIKKMKRQALRYSVKPLSKAEKKWLSGIADFFEKSGGVMQC